LAGDASFTWLLSEEILAEYKKVLRRLGVRRSLIGAIINLLREEAALIEVRSTSEISPDPGETTPFSIAQSTRLMEALEQDHSQALKQYLSSFGYEQPPPFSLPNSLPTTLQSPSQSITLHEVNRLRFRSFAGVVSS
jgi:hypothetical protein